MKMKHLFAGLVATLALGAATAVGVFASKNAEKEAKAAGSKSCTFITAEPSWNDVTSRGLHAWGEGNQTNLCGAWNDSQLGKMTLSDGYYRQTVSFNTSCDGAILRFKQGATYWQTVNLTISGGFLDGKTYEITGVSWKSDESGYKLANGTVSLYTPPAPVTHTFGLIGKGNWSSDFASFVEQQDGTFVASNISLTKGDIFKIRADGAWTKSWGVEAISGATNYFKEAASDNNIEVLVSGTYTFTLPSGFYSAGNATFTITPTIANGAYLRGSVIGWDEEDQIALTATGNANEYSITRNLVANEQVKVVSYNAGVASFIDPASYTSNHPTAYPVYLGGEYNNNPTVTNAGGYTIKVNVSTGAYTFLANDFVTPVATIYYSNSTTGETSTYDPDHEQSEIMVSLVKDEEFTVRAVNSFGTFYFGYEALESGDGSSKNLNEVGQGTEKSTGVHNIKVNTTAVYLLYVKDSGGIWMQTASASASAYNWATYFLANVGCDAKGVNLPSGWSTVSARYNSLKADAQAIIIAGTANENGDELGQALARYDYAVTHHAGLTRFITGRTISSGSGSRTLNIASNNEVAMPAIVAVTGLVTMTAVGGFFFLKKKPF